MSLFLSLFIILFFASALEVVYKKKIPYLINFFCITAIIALASRGEYGVDTKNYLLFFKSIGSKGALESGLDIGFFFFSVFIKWVYNAPFFFLFCIAFLSITFKVYAIKRLSPLPSISLFILFGTYFLSLETNQIRQAFALGLTLFSILFILKEKKWYFIVTIILASLLHVSALIFLPSWWLYKVRVSSKVLFLVLGISFLFVFVNVGEMFKMLFNILFVWNDFILNKLINYASKMEQVGFSPIHLWYLFVSTIFIYYRKNINTHFYRFLVFLFILGVSFNFIVNSFSYLIRVSYYFLVLEGIIFAMIIFHEKKLLNRILFYLLISIMLGYKIFSYYTQNIEFYQ